MRNLGWRLRWWREKIRARWSWWLHRRPGEELRPYLHRATLEALERMLPPAARLRARLVRCSCVIGVAADLAIVGARGHREVMGACRLHGPLEGVPLEVAMQGTSQLELQLHGGGGGGGDGGFLVPDSFADELAIMVGDSDAPPPRGILRRPAIPREEE